MRWQVKFYCLLALCFVVLMLGACATPKRSALSSEMNTIDVSKESIILLTIKTANEYKTTYQPNIEAIGVGEERKDGKHYNIKVEEKYKWVRNSFNEYLISFQLPPGKYILTEMAASTEDSSIGSAIGLFYVPVYSSFALEPYKIVYLGHIDAIVKERTDDKMLRAGPVLPLLSQLETGASSGTFAVTITDLFENDIKLFHKKFPFLTKYQVDNHTLPQWTQPTEEDMQ